MWFWRLFQSGGVPAGEAAGAFVENVDGLCWTEAETAGLMTAALEVWLHVGRRVDEAFPEVEVTAGVGGGGGPVQEVSGGSGSVEACSGDVGVEEPVALPGGAVGWSELNSEHTRWEESKTQPVKTDQTPQNQQQPAGG